jgi:hypothetical protein
MFGGAQTRPASTAIMGDAGGTAFHFERLKLKPQKSMETAASAVSPQPCGPEMSAEALVRARIEELGKWLSAQGVNVADDRAHIDQGSRDRLYWHFGYLIGLQEALKVLTSRSATVH